MLLELYKKECRQVMVSLTYFMFVVCIVIFFNSQMNNDQEMSMMQKPAKDQDWYGSAVSYDDKMIVENAISDLAFALYMDDQVFNTYPIGFIKKVTVNEQQSEEIKQIFCTLAGIEYEDYPEYMKSYEKIFAEASEDISFIPDNLKYKVTKRNENISLDEARELLMKVDHILGGGSDFSKKNLKFTRYDMSYEEALTEYDDYIRKDRISGGTARLFCDYMGVLLGILPVFLAAARGIKDRRSHAKEILYIREASSKNIILSRFLAMLTGAILPLLLLGTVSTLECIYYGNSIGIAADPLAFIKYIIIWLLPTVMTVLSVGIFVTELTESAAGILVQGIWWFLSLFLGSMALEGNFGFNLIPRFNTNGHYKLFIQTVREFAVNRIFYAILPLVLLTCAIFILEKKRKGKFHAFRTIRQLRKS